MTSMQSKLRRIGETLAAVVPESYHYWRPIKSAPYLIWAEDGEDSALSANNHKAEQALSGSVDYYTKTEFDPVADDIQEALNGIEGLGWVLESVQYEDETQLIHFEWRWVCDG